MAGRLRPGIDCARLPREAMFVAVPRKVDTMLPRANLARVERNRSGSCAVLFHLRRSCGVHQRPHAGAALWYWTRTRLLTHEQTNEFAAHEQLRAIDTRLKARTVFASSNTEIVDSKPLRGIDVCVRLSCVCVVLCVGSGLSMGWSPRPRSPTDCV
jgi:hypothetical protein